MVKEKQKKEVVFGNKPEKGRNSVDIAMFKLIDKFYAILCVFEMALVLKARELAQ